MLDARIARSLIVDESLNADKLIEFLASSFAETDRKVILILDNLPGLLFD